MMRGATFRPLWLAAVGSLAGFITAGVTLRGVGSNAPQAQPPIGAAVADGLFHSELSLGGRTTTLAYTPTLRAGDAAHAGLLAAPPRVGSRIRIGYIETTGPVRIGAIDITHAPMVAPAATSTTMSSSTRYDLFLQVVDDGWQLQLTDGANVVAGQVPLARKTVTPPAPTLSATLWPEHTTTGQLVLRWGGYESNVDVVFPSPTRRRLEENRTVNETINRRHDEDTSALSRARLLAQRNESALVWPTGWRASLSFHRTLARGERVEGNRGSQGLSVNGPDFARLMKTPIGEVVTLTEAPVPRLRIERPLQFGKTTLATGNQVPGFPGSYGLWLKRASSGWTLVFSHEPDVWGSQHDPKFDAAEIELAHSEGHAADRPFAAALVASAVDRGRLLILWGSHQWTADFVAVGR